MHNWLNDAVFYEIYPQSFKDSNHDGIGDFNGIIEKLDYIRDLGCNALWINPFYDSPFKDAGYDVRDYKKVAPRYGTNSDLYRLFGEAHNRNIHVLLDLVPGHTSEEHPWFKESQKEGLNEFTNRYIWTDGAFVGTPGHMSISGECERNGSYMLNFFKCQPALNYGFLEPKEDWQLSYTHPECIKTREAMKDIMQFWLDHGCDGFRVDMADSLVKDDDEKKSATCSIWKNIRQMLDEKYPEAALVSEWSNPLLSLNAGFHMDFYLDHHGNGYNTLLRDYETDGGDHSYFKKDGNGNILRFLDDYLPKLEATKNTGFISFMTCNHDTFRAKKTLTDRELSLAYACFFTFPGVPFLYYGDEIGMRYLDVKTKEGGYFRTGSRTPMQWDSTKNLGFSDAPSDCLYLSLDCSADAPTVQNQTAKEDSLLNTVRAILKFRHSSEDLRANCSFVPVYAKPDSALFIYQRQNLLLAVNPSAETISVSLDALKKVSAIRFSIGGGSLLDNSLTIEPQSFLILG